MKVYVFHTPVNETRGKIDRMIYEPIFDELTEEEKAQAILLDEEPAHPAPIEGKYPVWYIDLQTHEVEFEYLNIEVPVDPLAERIALLEQAMNEMLGVS